MKSDKDMRTISVQSMPQLDAKDQAEVDEISGYINAFIAERFPVTLPPDMKVILSDVMIEAIEWGAQWQERMVSVGGIALRPRTGLLLLRVVRVLCVPAVIRDYL